jgi:Ca2+-binding RTX toxin-like protein
MKKLLTGALLVVLSVGTLTLGTTTAAFSIGCTITGSSASEKIWGTRHADVICAQAGNDRIIARRGRDVLRGAGGNDRLVGRRGHDRLFGGARGDRLVSADGVSGNDRVFGRTGRDVCRIDEGDFTSGCERVVIVT